MKAEEERWVWVFACGQFSTCFQVSFFFLLKDRTRLIETREKKRWEPRFEKAKASIFCPIHNLNPVSTESIFYQILDMFNAVYGLVR